VASIIHNHIHLFLDSDDEPVHDSTMYHVAQPGPEERLTAAVSQERSLTGALHVHRLRNAGDIVTFRDAIMQVTATPAEKDALIALSGETCYYMPILHDDAPTFPVNRDAGNGYRCLMVIEPPIRQLTPAQEYWTVTIRVMEDTLT